MGYRNICHGCMQEKGDEQICSKCGWVEGSDQESPIFLKPGTVLAEKYLIGKVLGHGGFGITYLACDINLDFKLAIKEYLPQGMATRNLGQTLVTVYSGSVKEQFEYGLEKFLDEARTIAKFDEVPEIVKIRDFFKDNGTAYIVMNYIEGITLKEYITNNGGRLPIDAVLNIMLPVMKALEQVHKAGLLHRDISPDNIYITKKFQVKLLDFGAARFAMGEHSKSLSVVLKPGYAPEEQYRSKGKQGPWTDVYAAAATMYKALTGETPPESLDRLESDTLVLPSKMNVEIPEHMEAAIVKALKIRAAERYQSIDEFMDALLGQQVSEKANDINKQVKQDTEKTIDINNSVHDRTGQVKKLDKTIPAEHLKSDSEVPKKEAGLNPSALNSNTGGNLDPKRKNKTILIVGIALGLAALTGLSVLAAFFLGDHGGISGTDLRTPISDNTGIIKDSTISESTVSESTNTNVIDSRNLSGNIVVSLNASGYGKKDKFEQIAQEFMVEFPNTQVSFEPITENDNNLEQLLQIRLAANELTDITMLPNSLKNEQLPQQLLPLDELGFSNENLFTYDSGSFMGRLYKISPTADFSGILYNKKAFSRAGIYDIPLTKDDFFTACDKLKAVGITPVASGYTDGWPLYPWATVYPYEFSGDSGVKVKQIKTDAYISGPMIEGLDLLRELKERGYLEEDPNNANSIKMAESLKSGEAGMVYSGVWFHPNSSDIGIFPAPDVKALSVFSGYYYGIPKYSKSPEVAKAFLRFLLENDRYCNALGYNSSALKNSIIWPDYLKQLLSYGLPTVDASTNEDETAVIFKKIGIENYLDIVKGYINSQDPETYIRSINEQIASAK